MAKHEYHAKKLRCTRVSNILSGLMSDLTPPADEFEFTFDIIGGKCRAVISWEAKNDAGGQREKNTTDNPNG